MKLTFQKIGDALGVSKQRAHKLYQKGKVIIEQEGDSYRITRKESVIRPALRVYTVDSKGRVRGGGRKRVAES